MRVGGSVWELKIDPKRPRQKIKDDIAESRTKMNKKKQPEASKRGQREFQEGSRSVKKDFTGLARFGPAECAGPPGRIIGGVKEIK